MHSATRRIVGVTIAAAVASSLLLGAPSAGAALVPVNPATVGLFGQQSVGHVAELGRVQGPRGSLHGSRRRLRGC